MPPLVAAILGVAFGFLFGVTIGALRRLVGAGARGALSGGVGASVVRRGRRTRPVLRRD